MTHRLRILRAATLLLWSFACALPAAVAAPGDLDATFSGGRVTTTIGAFSRPMALVQQGDGKTVAAGFSDDSPMPVVFAVARYNANGTLDAGFGSGGIARIAFPEGSVFGQAVALQSDGKIVVAGTLGEAGDAAALARLNPDGSPDAGFGGGDGRVTFTFPGTFAAVPTGVAVMADGRIVVGALALGATQDLIAVARRMPDGSPDLSFSTDGYASATLAGDSAAERLRVQPDGKPVVAGTNAGAFAIARFNADGTPDGGFGTGGAATTPVAASDSMMGLVLQPDGKLVVAGSRDAGGGGTDIALVRYNANGTLDAGFGSGGIATLDLGSFDEVGDLLLMPNGKLVVAGSVFNGSIYESFLARFNANGTLDTSYGMGGHITAAMEAGSFFVNSALRQLDGRVILGGEYREQFGLARLLGAPEDALAASSDQDNDGVPNGVEAGVGLDPLVKDNDVFTGSLLFVMQQYRDFLGREGDAGGLGAWKAEIDSGRQTRPQVIQSFFDSQEFQNGLPQVVRLYFAFYNRIPDYPGLLFHVGRYRAGVPLATIAQDFAASQEFVNTYGSLSNAGYVDLVYQNVLGRPADPPGRQHWINQLDSGAMTRGEVMLAFSESQENLQTSASRTFVTSLYVGMLRRSPDPTGLQNGINTLSSGQSRAQLIAAFMNSVEYRNRFLR